MIHSSTVGFCPWRFIGHSYDRIQNSLKFRSVPSDRQTVLSAAVSTFVSTIISSQWSIAAWQRYFNGWSPEEYTSAAGKLQIRIGGDKGQ